LSLLLITVLGAAGCGSSTKTDRRATTLKVAYSIGPNSLDPALLDQSGEWFIDLAYDPLIQMGANGKPAPGLAKSWRYVGTDNKTFELSLRPNVRFSDGGALTAAGVKAHLEHVKKANGPNAAYLASLRSIDVVDPLTVRLKLSQPNPLLPTMLSHQYLVGDVISPTALERPSTLATHTAGAGPYVLDRAGTVSGDHYTYLPNPNYWNKPAIHYRRIEIKVIPNQNSVLDALRTGQANVAGGDYTTAAGAKRAGLTVKFTPQVFMGLLLGDRGGKLSKPLADLRVRQAINHALDRKAIVKAMFDTYGRPTTQTSNGDGYTPALDEAYAYDPAKAKALLAQAGYPDGFTLPVLSTPLFSGDTMTQAMAGQLQAVGIKLKTTSVSNAALYAGRLFGAKYPAATIGYGSQPMYLEGPGLYLPNAAFNPFRSSDPQLTDLYGRLAGAPPEQIGAMSRQIQQRLVDLAWFAPVGLAPLVYYADKSVDPGSLKTSPQAPIPPIAEIRPAS
jgi:peptide/nickel transport system substrate-binding protein